MLGLGTITIRISFGSTKRGPEKKQDNVLTTAITGSSEKGKPGSVPIRVSFEFASESMTEITTSAMVDFCKSLINSYPPRKL